MSRAASLDKKFGQPGANSEWRKHRILQARKRSFADPVCCDTPRDRFERLPSTRR
jgi:hypothetical protein